MVLMDEEEPSGLDLSERIRSQCVLVSPKNFNNTGSPTGPMSIINTSGNVFLKFASMMAWLNERATRQSEIPFADAERGVLPNMDNKWASESTAEGVLFWISNKTVRTEFVLTWQSG